MRLSTLGIRLGYAVETTIGNKPAAFTELGLVSQIGGINLDQEQIDVTVIADTIKHYVKGQQDTGGTWDISFVADPDVSITQIKTIVTIHSYSPAASPLRSTVPPITKAGLIVPETSEGISSNSSRLLPL